MFGKGRIICSLTIIALVGSVAMAWTPAAPDPNLFGTTDYDKQFDPNYTWQGRTPGFDWFDTDAWWDSAASPNDPNIGPQSTFTWSSFYNDTPNLTLGYNVQIDYLDYRNDHSNSNLVGGPNVVVTLHSGTATCDIQLDFLAVGRYWWCHWGNLDVDGVNLTLGQQDGVFNCSWNRLSVAREGNAWVTLKDSIVKTDVLNAGEKTVPPYQYDSTDANNLAWDPTTWTMAWPARCLKGAEWGYNWVKLQGTTQYLHQEPGFFVRLGRGRGSDCWPGRERATDLFLEATCVYTGVDANTAPNPDPNWGMGHGTSIRLFPKVELHYGMGAAAVLCPMEMTGTGELYNGVTIDLVPEGTYSNPTPGTNKVLMTVGAWHSDPANNYLPSLSTSTDPNWTLTFQGPTLVATYKSSVATVVARKVFHNNSAYDTSAAAEATDDNAIDTSKTPLLPGQTASYSSYVCNESGINGVMIDIMAPQATPVAADFSAQVSGVSNGNAIGDYGAGVNPTSILVRAGAGVGGSDRVHLIFPSTDADNSKWMRLTTSATNIGLAANDVCYIGLAVGDTGNSAVDTYVNASDRLGARANPHTGFDPAPVTDAYDVNRDSLVNATDRLKMRNHGTTGFNDLLLITAP